MDSSPSAIMQAGPNAEDVIDVLSDVVRAIPDLIVVSQSDNLDTAQIIRTVGTASSAASSVASTVINADTAADAKSPPIEAPKPGSAEWYRVRAYFEKNILRKLLLYIAFKYFKFRGK